MSFEILNRYTKTLLYKSKTAENVRDAAIEAAAKGADLRGADLRGAYLRGAYLSGADLRGAYLSGADLSGADLSGADLRGAYLRGADLSGADLSGAYLSGAYLRGAYLSGAKGLLHNGTVPLQIFGTKHSLIVRESGYITIGCHHKTLAWWEEHYSAVGRTEGYSELEVMEYAAHIAHAKAWMVAHGVAEVLTPAATEAVA